MHTPPDPASPVVAEDTSHPQHQFSHPASK
jgi:hypothetical protein